MSVISTEFGLRGYDDLRPYVTVCNIEQFADAIRCQQPLDPAIVPMLHRYRWDRIVTDIKEMYLSLVENNSYCST